jgi:hypothetical protein
MTDSTEDLSEDTSVLSGEKGDDSQDMEFSVQDVPANSNTIATEDNDESGNEDVPDPIAPDSGEAEQGADLAEIRKMQETLQDLMARANAVSSGLDSLSNDTARRLDTLSSDTANLATQIAGISGMCGMLIQEDDSSDSGASTKNFLSKSFLFSAVFILVLLVAFQVYTYVSLVKIQRLQNVAGSSLVGNLSALNTKLADFDKKMALAPEKPVQQEHAQHNPAATETVGAEAHASGDAEPVVVTPVAEKLNRIRNGLPEKKLIRKETGDWFIYNKKGSESIADVEVIKALNEAYTKIGRAMKTKIPLPAHNAVCLLKPDGKGGTLVVMTGEFIP